MENETDLIPGIFNYCDRWCERCDFSGRCRVFADERAMFLEDSDDPMGDALLAVAESFAEAKAMLEERAEEMGIDLEAAMNDPEIEEEMRRSSETVRSEEASKLAIKYSLETRALLDNPETWAGDAEEDPIIADTLEVLCYYLFSVAVKVQSSFNAALDTDGNYEAEQISHPQSYANGTAKITLIILERSILGWTYLMSENNTAVVRPVIEQLERIRHLLEKKFPNARDFIRPGFDEIETIM
ncbi:MAG: hypothetical protein ABL999_01360 [Pyrinomonadaceae bacterium]